MARPKGSERRKQRLHSIATASSDPIHPSAEQTQPIPSESSFEFSSPFPTTRCSGSSASSASSSSSSSTAAEAEAEVEFERDDLEITKRSLVDGFSLTRHDRGIESGRHTESIGASSISSGLSPTSGDGQPTLVIFFPAKTDDIDKSNSIPVTSVSSGSQSTDQSADLDTVVVGGEGPFQNLHLQYQIWSLFPGYRLSQDPEGWWREPRDFNMHSQMTPRTLESTDSVLAAGQRNSDLKIWEAGFDPRLFARSLRLFPDQKPLFVPYTICGTRASFKAYHEPINAWCRRREASAKLNETLSPDVQLHADPRELQFVAAYFFSGREVPENLAADAISLPSREELTGPGSTFWGRVLANKLLKKTTLAIFLIDLIMANKMEHACFNKEKYFEDRVRRHDTYEEVVKRLGSEKSTSTPMACRDTSQQEEHETEDKAPGNDDLTEPDSVNNTPQPASSKKRKKNKKKNTKGITDTPTKDTSGEGPAPAITLNETPQDNQNTSGDGPVPAVTPTVTPQDIQDTCQDGATSPKSDEEKDSPPRKPLSKPEILPRLSDSIDTEDSAGWNIVESKASQRIKARGNARGSLFDLFPDASSSSNKAEQPLSGNASQRPTAPPRRSAQPSPTAQNRPPPSPITGSLVSPAESGQSPTVKKPMPPTAKHTTSRVFNATEYPPMPSTPPASNPRSSRTRGPEGSKFPQRSDHAGAHLNDSTSERVPVMNRASTIKPQPVSTSHPDSLGSKDARQSSEREISKKRTPSVEIPKAAVSHQSPPRNKLPEDSQPWRAPPEQETPAVEKLKVSKSHRSPTRSRNPEWSPGRPSLDNREQQTSAVENPKPPTPNQSFKRHSSDWPKKQQLDESPRKDRAPAAGASTARASTTYDEQNPDSLPELSNRDVMMAASQTHSEGIKVDPSDDLKSDPGFILEEPKSTTVPETSNNAVSISQDASVAASTLEVSPQVHIAYDSEKKELKDPSRLATDCQTPADDEGNAADVPLLDKLVAAFTAYSGVSTQPAPDLKASNEGGPCANTIPGSLENTDDHTNQLQPQDDPVLHSNVITPRKTNESPLRRKRTQSLPESPSQKMGVDAQDQDRPIPAVKGSNEIQDLPVHSPIISPKLTSSIKVRKTPRSDKRKSQPRQPSFGNPMAPQPSPFGQNNYGANYNGPPPPPFGSMPMGLMQFPPNGHPIQPYPPSMYGPQLPSLYPPPMYPGYPLNTAPYMAPMMGTLGNHSAMISTYGNSPKKGVALAYREVKSTDGNGGDSFPMTPQDSRNSVANGNDISKSTGTPVQKKPSDFEGVDLDKVAQTEAVAETQDLVHPGLDNTDDAATDSRGRKVTGVSQDVVAQHIENSNLNVAANGPGRQSGSNHANLPSDHGKHGQENGHGGANLSKNLLAPRNGNGAGSEPRMNTQKHKEIPANVFQPWKYPATLCTFCTRECPRDRRKPVFILCSGCGPGSNICYCSQACIVGDAYGHKVRCQMVPISQRGHEFKPPIKFGYQFYVNPIMPMDPFNDSPEKFRQKTFMMYCPKGSFPKILKAWGRRDGNKIPEGVDVDEDGKKTGRYFVFRSRRTAVRATPNKVLLSGKNLIVNRFNHEADVIFTVRLPRRSQEEDFLSRALNCCFLSDDEGIKESLFRLIRHYILDEREFNRLKHEEPLDVVFEEFQHQFAKEFRFDVTAVRAEKAGYTLNSLMQDEWKRCGAAIELLESRNEVLHNWRPIHD